MTHAETPERTPSTFELRDVVVERTQKVIIDHVSTDIRCDGVTAMAGPSGSGKSTLLRLLNRLDDPTSGTIWWGGRSLADWEPPELRRRVAMVFQRPALFEGTVLDNLRVARPGLDEAGAVAVLSDVDLMSDLLDRPASQLSGGEAQRMCLARSLLTDPEVVLADEPTASLDETPRRNLEQLARRLADRGVAMIWVTHDVAQLRRLADRAIVIVEGRVMAAASLPELDEHPDAVVRALVGA